MCLSTCCLLVLLRISIKSTIIIPPRSLRRSCLAISSAASKLVFSAVSSIPLSLTLFPEFTSIDTSASVGSMTIYPPERRLTVD